MQRSYTKYLFLFGGIAIAISGVSAIREDAPGSFLGTLAAETESRPRSDGPRGMHDPRNPEVAEEAVRDGIDTVQEQVDDGSTEETLYEGEKEGLADRLKRHAKKVGEGMAAVWDKAKDVVKEKADGGRRLVQKLGDRFHRKPHSDEDSRETTDDEPHGDEQEGAPGANE